MRKLMMSVVLGTVLMVGVGCMLPAYSGDPNRRTTELIWTSENFRLFHDEWERLWMLDQPNHCTPWRTHGGVI